MAATNISQRFDSNEPIVTPQSPSSDIEASRSKHLDNFQTPSFPQPADILLDERVTQRLISASFILFTLGWGDGVTGTLLPYFKRDFNISFMTSSLLFVTSALGYAFGTVSVELVMNLLGRERFYAGRGPPTLFSFPLFRRHQNEASCAEADRSVIGFSVARSRFFTLTLASVLHAVFFMIMGSKQGFPSMMVAYAITGIARSLLLATLNLYVSLVSKRALGYMYGSWAVGAFAAPLVCQSIIATGIRWANFYYGSLVLSALNISLIVYAFWPAQGELQRDADFAWSLWRPPCSPSDMSSPVSITSDSQVSPESRVGVVLSRKDAVQAPRTYTKALKKPKMWASALFSMIYTGSESSTQGFIVVYLLAVRNANQNAVGYVTSGFWGGMAVSRFLWGYLGWIVTFRQRKWIVQGCMYVSNSIIAFCMHLLIWFVPSFPENVFSVAVIGFVYGPIYPANLGTARDLLPAEVHLVSLAIVAAFGSIGAALFPFITGTLVTTVGPRTLPYITVSQCIAMFVFWSLFPSKPPVGL